MSRNRPDPDDVFPTEQLVTPHGTEILVSKNRAEHLLGRSPLQMQTGELRGYRRLNEKPEVK